MENYTQYQVNQYSKWAARAIRHSVPLDDIIHATKDYHGEEFAAAVEDKVKDLIQ